LPLCWHYSLSHSVRFFFQNRQNNVDYAHMSCHFLSKIVQKQGTVIKYISTTNIKIPRSTTHKKLPTFCQAWIKKRLRTFVYTTYCGTLLATRFFLNFELSYPQYHYHVFTCQNKIVSFVLICILYLFHSFTVWRIRGHFSTVLPLIRYLGRIFFSAFSFCPLWPAHAHVVVASTV